MSNPSSTDSSQIEINSIYPYPMNFNFYKSSIHQYTFAGLLAMTATFSAKAQEVVLSDSTRENILNPVVVTATRYETRKENIPQKLDIITRQDIEMTPSNDLTDIVRKTAAVDVIQYPNL